MEVWESMSISISFSWQIAFPHNKDLGQLVPDFSPSQHGAHRICFPTKNSGVEMGHANVHECSAWMQDHVHILYV